MFWNHRVVVRNVGDERLYSIYEAYYDDDNTVLVSKDHVPVFLSKDPVPALGGSVQELKQDLERMQKALERAVLQYEDFKRENTSGSGEGSSDG